MSHLHYLKFILKEISSICLWLAVPFHMAADIDSRGPPYNLMPSMLFQPHCWDNPAILALVGRFTPFTFDVGHACVTEIHNTTVTKKLSFL